MFFRLLRRFFAFYLVECMWLLVEFCKSAVLREERRKESRHGYWRKSVGRGQKTKGSAQQLGDCVQVIEFSSSVNCAKLSNL